jgi:ATP-dependent RNA helicase DeaD
MPDEIRKVAERHLNEPRHIRIASRTTTAENIRQRYWPVGGLHKLDALTRMLENEPSDGVIVFVRTKTQTVELAEKLSARGFAAEALNGDVAQVQRERTVDRLRDGKTDILVATDVVARGLDVKRVTHVINYDIPYDTESYVHRIGRTGRAGAAGEAILFVAPRERRMLRTIEKATGQRIEPMDLPSVQDINSKRTERFKAGVRETIENEDLSLYYRLVSELEQEDDLDALQIAAALARLAQGEAPLLLDPRGEATPPAVRGAETGGREQERRPARAARPPKTLETEALPLKDFPEVEMERFRLAVGYRDGVKPANIVGAIANEAQLESRYIGHIEIHDEFSTVDLPAGMPDETLRDLQNSWVCQRRLAIQRLKDYDPDKVVAAGHGRGPAEKPPGRARGKAKTTDPRRDPAQRSSRTVHSRGEGDAGPGRGGPPRHRPAGEGPAGKRPFRRDGAGKTAGGGRRPASEKDAEGARALPRSGARAAARPGGKPVPAKRAGKGRPAGDRPPKARLTLKKDKRGGPT